MANEEYKLSASFQVIGGFWEFVSPDKTFAGTLTAKNGQVTLATAPTYSKGNALADFRDAILAVNQPQNPARIESFCGFTSIGDCTLLSSFRTTEEGQVNTSTNQSVVSQHYRASTSVIGLHLESGDAKSIESAAFYYTNTEEYLPPGWTFQFLPEETVYTAPRKARNVFQFFSTVLDAEVTCPRKIQPVEAGVLS
jgi:ApeA N-terminal domain 1